MNKESMIGIILIVLLLLISGCISQNSNASSSQSEPKQWCVPFSQGIVCYGSPEHDEQVHLNGHDVWVTENDSTGEIVRYIEYNGSKYFYDGHEVEKNHSVYPIFSNGKERIVVHENEFPKGDTIEKYILPYMENLSVKYDVEKVVYTPDFLIYYWNNNTLTTLVPSGSDVVTTIRSYDNRLILVKEYHDNYMTIRYWQLNLSKNE